MAWPNQDEHICGVAQAQQYRTAEADGDDNFLCDDSFFRGQVRPAFWCRCTALDPSERGVAHATSESHKRTCGPTRRILDAKLI